MIEIVEDPVDESMSGTLWLFPSAVCLLVISQADGIGWCTDSDQSSSNGMEQDIIDRVYHSCYPNDLGSWPGPIGVPRHREQEGHIGWE